MPTTGPATRTTRALPPRRQISTMDLAVLRCMEICAEEGWLPSAEQTIKLIRLRDEHRAGRRSEDDDTADSEEARRRLHRLEWVRWMTQRGVLNEG
jgi:hypothetical protein